MSCMILALHELSYLPYFFPCHCSHHPPPLLTHFLSPPIRYSALLREKRPPNSASNIGRQKKKNTHAAAARSMLPTARLSTASGVFPPFHRFEGYAVVPVHATTQDAPYTHTHTRGKKNREPDYLRFQSNCLLGIRLPCGTATTRVSSQGVGCPLWLVVVNHSPILDWSLPHQCVSPPNFDASSHGGPLPATDGNNLSLLPQSHLERSSPPLLT